MRRNTAFAFGVQIATTAFTIMLTLVLVRVLGVDRYGTFSVALAVGGLVLLPADFGISASASRFLAEAVNDAPRRRATIVAAFRLKLASSLAAGVGLALLAGPIAAIYGQPALVWPLRGVAIAVAGQGIMRLAAGACGSQQRSGLSFVVVSIESFAETVASIALVAAGGGAAGAAFGRSIGYAVGAIVGVIVIVRLFDVAPRALVTERIGSPLGRRIAGYAGVVAVVDSVWALFMQIDILLIGAVLTTGAAGIFQAPVRLLTVVSYPGIALGVAIGPRLARVSADSRPDASVLVQASRLLLVAQTLAAALVVAWARPLTSIVLGGGYSRSAVVLMALGPYVALSGLAPLLSNAIDYVGATRRRVAVGFASVALNAAIDAALLPRLGVVAAAIGTDVGYALYVAGHVRVAREMLGMDVMAVTLTLVRCTTAGTATAFVLYGGAQAGVVGFVLAGTATLPVYIGLLLLLGEGSLLRPLMQAAPTWARTRRTPSSA